MAYNPNEDLRPDERECLNRIADTLDEMVEIMKRDETVPLDEVFKIPPMKTVTLKKRGENEQ